jgi:hypothetical protein
LSRADRSSETQISSEILDFVLPAARARHAISDLSLTFARSDHFLLSLSWALELARLSAHRNDLRVLVSLDRLRWNFS